jgi:serine/threonine protein kinase
METDVLTIELQKSDSESELELELELESESEYLHYMLAKEKTSMVHSSFFAKAFKKQWLGKRKYVCDEDKDNKLGSGSFSSVFQATEVCKKKRVILKFTKSVLSENKDDDFEMEEKLFKSEAMILVHFRKNPLIVQLKDFISMEKEHGGCALVYDYDEDFSKDLVQVSRKFILDEESIRRIVFQLLLAVVEINKAGFMHLDIKPDNILLNEKNSKIKLIDFGMARKISESNGSKSGSKSGKFSDIRGSVYYMAPEMIGILDKSSNGYSYKADVFSIGVILYFFMFRRYPFSKEMVYDKLKEVFFNSQKDKSLNLVSEKFNLDIDFSSSSPPFSLFSSNSPFYENALDLVKSLLEVDPDKRPDAIQALRHSFFKFS